jgi:hypothetical protein
MVMARRKNVVRKVYNEAEDIVGVRVALRLEVKVRGRTTWQIVTRVDDLVFQNIIEEVKRCKLTFEN